MMSLQMTGHSTMVTVQAAGQTATILGAGGQEIVLRQRTVSPQIRTLVISNVIYVMTASAQNVPLTMIAAQHVAHTETLPCRDQTVSAT